jgi:hypothetical protein
MATAAFRQGPLIILSARSALQAGWRRRQIMKKPKLSQVVDE